MAPEIVSQVDPAPATLSADHGLYRTLADGSDRAAIIVNPDATPLELVSWAYHQTQLISTFMERLANGGDDELMDEINMLLAPVASALFVAADLLRNAETPHG